MSQDQFVILLYFNQWLMQALHIYTPGIYVDGYIVFAFPLVRSYVHLFVGSFVILERSWNLCQSLC